jgi:ABC-2 type transport system ATP-binding protein
MTTPILEVVDLHKKYGPTIALDGVGFQVEVGEIFGLLGPNGAGKTSLLSIISCLMTADAGEVRLSGRRLNLSDRSQRCQIGIVPQELALYGELTGRENLTFFGELYGLDSGEIRQRVGEILAAVGLEDKADSRVNIYSGGMKRRLNLGAALVHRPKLLLLDEPTTGVDPQSRNHIFEEVRRLNGEGVTVVYTSHYMEEVQALCKRIGIMDNGRLIACDTLSGLLQKLQSSIRLRVPTVTSAFRERIMQIPEVVMVEQANATLELECRDVKATLPQLIAVLNEFHVPLVSLETEEPNLERVFLFLTHRALRD